MANQTTYRLVVDTDAYAGNFERESIAFATGLVGECEVGSGEAALALDELDKKTVEWWKKHAIHQVDEENGCRRPALLVPTPGYFNNGYGQHFEDTPENEKIALEKFQQTILAHKTKNIEDLERVTLGQGGWTVDTVARHKKSYELDIQNALALKSPKKFPSYQSVAIDVSSEPPEYVLQSFFSRMREYIEEQNAQVIGQSLESKTIAVKTERMFKF